MAVRNLSFVLSGTDKSASSTFEKVGKKADGLNGKLAGLGGAAKLGAAGLAAGAVASAPAIFGMAAQMEQLDSKVKTVFGDSVGTVDKWAKANANAMGLTKKEASGLAAGFADLLIPMGFTREQAAKMSTETVGLSGALAQWSGGKVSAAEASDVLAKAMLGERDGLKALGISISDADVKARLLKNGQDGLKGAALEQAKAVATQQLIMEKSTDAQAAFAKSSGTLAGKQAVATAKLKELKDKGIGALIPVLHAGTGFISRLSEGFQNGSGAGGKLREAFDKVKKTFEENRPQIEKLVKAIGQVAEVVITKVVPMAVKFQAEVISKMISGIGLLVDAFNGIKGVVQAVVGAVVPPFLDFFGMLVNGAASAFGWVPGIGGKLKNAAREFETFKTAANISLQGIQDKEITVSIKKSEAKRDEAWASRGTVPSMRPTATPRAKPAPVVVHNRLSLDGRVIADSTRQIDEGRRSRGLVTVSGR